MSRVPDRVRLMVVQWPADAPRGAVQEFCDRHGVSRSWFFSVRARAVTEGNEAVVKRSTRPRSSPTAVPEGVVAAVTVTRGRLLAEGKDHGPLSILDVLRRSGMAPLPSRSTVSRILDREHLVDRNKRKRPKRSHRRFGSEYPNQRWQADGVSVRLASGERVVVVEIVDDCMRFNIALFPGVAEDNATVVEAFRGAIAHHGRPVLVHTDNGVAFNQRRLGKATVLETFLNDMGVKMITGRPGHPQSQGKVERAHQTLLKYIGQRRPTTIDELRVVLEQYRQWFNHDRSHQALPPNTAPADLYETLPKVSPPGDPITPARPSQTDTVTDVPPRQKAFNEPIQHRTAARQGGLTYWRTKYLLGTAWTGQTITIIRDTHELQFYDSNGTQIATSPWPATRRELSLYRQIDTQPPTLNSPLCPETEESTMS